MDIDIFPDKDVVSKERRKAYEDVILIMDAIADTLPLRSQLKMLKTTLSELTGKNKVSIKDGTDINRDFIVDVIDSSIQMNRDNTQNYKRENIYNSLIKNHGKQLRKYTKESRRSDTRRLSSSDRSVY